MMKRIANKLAIFFTFVVGISSAWGWPWSKGAATGNNTVTNLGSVDVGTTGRIGGELGSHLKGELGSHLNN